MDWVLYYAQGIEMLYLGIGSYLDMKNRELPILYFIIFGIAGIAYNRASNYQSTASMVFGACIGCVFLIIGWITKEAIGYGDGLGVLVLGIMEGGMGSLPILFSAFFMSGMYGLWRMFGLKKISEDSIPLFPFLFAGLLGGIFL